VDAVVENIGRIHGGKIPVIDFVAVKRKKKHEICTDVS
jgi:hypothetical protein